MLLAEYKGLWVSSGKKWQIALSIQASITVPSYGMARWGKYKILVLEGKWKINFKR